MTTSRSEAGVKEAGHVPASDSVAELRRTRLALNEAIALGGDPELEAIRDAIEDALIEALIARRRSRGRPLAGAQTLGSGGVTGRVDRSQAVRSDLWASDSRGWGS